MVDAGQESANRADKYPDIRGLGRVHQLPGYKLIN